MTRSEEYRHNAEAVEAAARKAARPDDRDAYEKIAKGWRELIAAEQRRRQLGP